MKNVLFGVLSVVVVWGWIDGMIRTDRAERGWSQATWTAKTVAKHCEDIPQ